MASRKRSTYPLVGEQVFGTRSVDEQRVVWRGGHVQRINKALGVEGDEFTSRTREAVLEKQRSLKSLDVTGVVDEKTWKAILD